MLLLPLVDRVDTDVHFFVYNEAERDLGENAGIFFERWEWHTKRMKT